jgi:hypothetical protein
MPGDYSRLAWQAKPKEGDGLKNRPSQGCVAKRGRPTTGKRPVTP